MLTRFLDPVPDHLYHRDPGEANDADLTLRYLGTAGFVLEGDGRTVVVDPFITRPGIYQTLFKPLAPDERLIRAVLPRADEVLIGHAHHDHVLDGPTLCHQTGARFIGSPSACNVARAAGLPTSQLVETRGRETIPMGRGLVKGLPSLHGRVYFNTIPLPGTIDAPPQWPPRYRQLRHGLVLNWYIEMAGLRIVHIDSADFIDRELEGLEADVVCLCAIGRRYRPNYVEDCIRLLRPKMVIACHWDWFFTPYHTQPLCLPGVNLPGFVEEIRRAGADPIVLPFEGRLGLHAD
ncbi:MAG: MBL fold metallo-hydrolase [Myxococcota bacterium]